MTTTPRTSRFAPKAAPAPAPADTRPATASTVERLTPYTVGTPDADALAALGMTPAELDTANALAHRIDVDPALLPGIVGLFSASVSIPDADDDRRAGSRAAAATLYLSPVAAPGLSARGYRRTNDLDMTTDGGAAWDPRAVRVEGITQGVAGYTVNGKPYTGTVEIRELASGQRYAYAPGAELTDAARRRFDDAADALAAAYLTPERLAAAAVTLTVSTLQHATRAALRADAVRASAQARAEAARASLAALTA